MQGFDNDIFASRVASVFNSSTSTISLSFRWRRTVAAEQDNRLDRAVLKRFYPELADSSFAGPAAVITKEDKKEFIRLLNAEQRAREEATAKALQPVDIPVIGTLESSGFYKPATDAVAPRSTNTLSLRQKTGTNTLTTRFQTSAPVANDVAATKPGTLKLKKQMDLPLTGGLSAKSSLTDLAAAFRAEQNAMLREEAPAPVRRADNPAIKKSLAELAAESLALEAKTANSKFSNIDLSAAFKQELTGRKTPSTPRDTLAAASAEPKPAMATVHQLRPRKLDMTG
jgi:hypothetical protein